jgi:hypothetical protein
LLIDTTYAVEQFGEAKPPQALYFLVLVAGKAGHEHQKGMILGGPQAPQTPRLAGDRVSRVIDAFRISML